MNGSPNSGGYRVLARKYRPRDFDELIGQEALVRTLSNAIAIGRVAHAFILTGVRGVGKTTTARIIARALNCIGRDGQGGPTIKPCGECEHCTAIAEDRHVDVIEVDAASRTGIGDIRELIESLRYKPVSARNKIYIIDEVHMLSTAAFNGLLKTLEEPPDNVVFVFATTEIRRVPVTVLSRCQRFDLRRVDSDALAGHFAMVSAKEEVEIEPAAIDIIARAADGSVRDGLSLLDQAMALLGGAITATQIRDMLGLADRVAIFDLFDSVMSGDIASALDRFQIMYRDGADPVIVIQDLLEVTHWLTRLKIAPALAEEPGVPEEERVRGAKMSQSLSMALLTRCWQMLLKGLGETQIAPAPLAAAEMLLIRMTHAADLPPPAELIKSLQQDTPAPMPAGGSAAQSSAAPAPTSLAPSPSAIETARPSSFAVNAVAPQPAADPAPLIDPEAAVAADTAGKLRRYEDVVALFDEKREGIMTAHLRQDVHLVGFSQHRIEFRPGPNAPRDLANRMGRLLSDWTGERWIVSVSDAPGGPTLAEQRAAMDSERLAEAERDPLVQAVKETFPGAKIRGIIDRSKGASPDTQENDET